MRALLRPLPRSLLRGVHCRCPACGIGRLFPRYLKLTPECGHCGEALYHARPDDAAPRLLLSQGLPASAGMLFGRAG